MSNKRIRTSESLDAEKWHKVIVGERTVQDLVSKIREDVFPTWHKPLLRYSSFGDSMLELGCGTGELSAVLGIYGRTPYLLDYSSDSIRYARGVFQDLMIKGSFCCADILEGIPVRTASMDWVWSSGLLEHFTDDQVLGILEECVRVCRKGVMSLVPNAGSIFYRIGKFCMERKGTWPYGSETPRFTMRNHFKKSGLRNIKEYSVGVYHALEFWDSDASEIRRFYDSLSIHELRKLNQGYLLFTYGEKID